jgi:hypothetical protein
MSLKKRLAERFKHAFAFEKIEDFDPDERDQELIEVVCGEVVKRGMATPATLFLESTRPLNYVGSQTMVFFEPVMRAVLRNPQAWERFSKILEHRGSIEYLCRRIEALDQARSSKRAASKKAPSDPPEQDSEQSRKADETNSP